jgi:hypothetical protein
MEWVVITLVVIFIFLLFFRHASKFQNQIPKQIWSYWDSDDVPDFVQRCISSWKKTSPDYKVNILSKNTVKNYVKPPPNFESLPPQKQSDWVRLAVIKNFGGVWLDASTIVTINLSWIDSFGKNTVVYYIDSNSPDKKFLNIENWFIASVPQSEFINSWFNEFDYSIRKYKEKGHLHYEEIKKNYGNNIADGAGSMIHAPDYYDQHISVQKIIRGDKIPLSSVKILKAEDGPLYHSFSAKDPGWKYIIRDNTNEFTPPIIKIIGHERHEIAKMDYTVHPNSIYKKYLE